MCTGISIVERQSAFQRRMRVMSIVNNNTHLVLNSFLTSCLQHFKDIIEKCPQPIVKTFSLPKADFIRHTADTDIVDTFNLTTRNLVLNISQDVGQFFLDNVQDRLLTKLSEFHERDSEWSLFNILELTIHINEFSPISGACVITLPVSKTCIINVDNLDDKYFKWAILAGLYHNNERRHPSSILKYTKYENTLNFDYIEFPVQITDFGKFESQNVVSINVFALQRKLDSKYEVIPIYLTSRKKTKQANLLLVHEKYEDEETKDKSSLLSNHILLFNSNLNNHYCAKLVSFDVVFIEIVA